jgi:DNA-binding response OmpR family regulator
MGTRHLGKDEIIQESQNIQNFRAGDIEKGNVDTITNLLEKISSLSPEKKKILIVEDNEDIRLYLNDILLNHFIVEEAEDGLAGLKQARKIHPALIISDIMMPEMDGLELCKILKSELETSHIPILMITANLTHHIHINSFEVGADAYITKPFRADLLLSRIYNLLKSREKLRDYYLNKFKSGFVSENNSLSRDEEFLMKVNKLIHQNLSNKDFSIALLHQSLGMSRTVFYNKIKSLTNYSPIDLIRQIRLKKAADLLSTREYRVYEVMLEVGFNDEKHFRQLFKNQFGIMPSEYLQANRKN